MSRGFFLIGEARKRALAAGRKKREQARRRAMLPRCFGCNRPTRSKQTIMRNVWDSRAKVLVEREVLYCGRC
jgi:hypothetical protein